MLLLLVVLYTWEVFYLIRHVPTHFMLCLFNLVQIRRNIYVLFLYGLDLLQILTPHNHSMNAGVIKLLKRLTEYIVLRYLWTFPHLGVLVYMTFFTRLTNLNSANRQTHYISTIVIVSLLFLDIVPEQVKCAVFTH